MPCGSGEDHTAELHHMLAKLKRVTCDLAKYWRNHDHIITVETATWIAAHEAEDRERIRQESEMYAKEATKKQALAKLTPEEKKALGLS